MVRRWLFAVMLSVTLGLTGWALATLWPTQSVTAATDGFDLALWPKHMTVWQTFTDHHVIALAGKNGFNGNVNISVSGLPSGTVGVDSDSAPFYFCPSTCLAKPNSPSPWSVGVKDGERTTLNPNFGTYGTPVPTGTYTVTVTASADGYETKSDTLTLKVVDNTSDACDPLISILADGTNLKRTITAGQTISGPLIYRNEPCQNAEGAITEYAGSGSFTSNGAAAGMPGLHESMSLTLSPSSGSLDQDQLAQGTGTYTLTTSTSTPNGSYAILPATSANGSYYPLSVIGVIVTGGSTGTSSTSTETTSGSTTTTESATTTEASATTDTPTTTTESTETATTTEPKTTASFNLKAQTPTGPGLSFSREEAAVGEKVTATGERFAKDAELTLYWHPYTSVSSTKTTTTTTADGKTETKTEVIPPRVGGLFELGKGKTDKSGKVSIEFTVPSGIRAGLHSIRLTNAEFGDKEQSADAAFKVALVAGMPTTLEYMMEILSGKQFENLKQAGSKDDVQRLAAQAQNLTEAATNPEYPAEPIVAANLLPEATTSRVARSVEVSLGGERCSVSLRPASNPVFAFLDMVERTSTAHADTCGTQSLGTAYDAQPINPTVKYMLDNALAAAARGQTELFVTSIANIKGSQMQSILEQFRAEAAKRPELGPVVQAVDAKLTELSAAAAPKGGTTSDGRILLAFEVPDGADQLAIYYPYQEDGKTQLARRGPISGGATIDFNLVENREHLFQVKRGSQTTWYKWISTSRKPLGNPVDKGQNYTMQVLAPKDGDPEQALQVSATEATELLKRWGGAAAQVSQEGKFTNQAANRLGQLTKENAGGDLSTLYDRERKAAFATALGRCGLQDYGPYNLSTDDKGNTVMCLKSHYDQATRAVVIDADVRMPSTEFSSLWKQASKKAEAAWEAAAKKAEDTLIAEAKEKGVELVRVAGGGIQVANVDFNKFKDQGSTLAVAPGDLGGGDTSGTASLGMTTIPVSSSATVSSGFIESAHAQEETAAEDDLKFISTNYIEISVAGPVHGLLVVDPTDRAVGYNPISGGGMTQIPGALYYGDQTTETHLTLPELVNGEYGLSVYGLEDGQYTGTVSIYAGDQVTQRSIAGTVKKGESTSIPFEVALDVTTMSTDDLLNGPTSPSILRTVLMTLLTFVILGVAGWAIWRRHHGLSLLPSPRAY